jgi:hypothetical protein
MQGFITTPETATAINDAIANAQTSRNLPVYWLIGQYPIFTGEHAGKAFMPLDDPILNTVLYQGIKPTDFPEFEQLVVSLGGLDARIDLDPSAIIDPNASPF